MPFGEYKDFEDCVRRNEDKDDPRAYCAAIERTIAKHHKAKHFEKVEARDPSKHVDTRAHGYAGKAPAEHRKDAPRHVLFWRHENFRSARPHTHDKN